MLVPIGKGAPRDSTEKSCIPQSCYYRYCCCWPLTSCWERKLIGHKWRWHSALSQCRWWTLTQRRQRGAGFSLLEQRPPLSVVGPGRRRKLVWTHVAVVVVVVVVVPHLLLMQFLWMVPWATTTTTRSSWKSRVLSSLHHCGIIHFVPFDHYVTVVMIPKEIAAVGRATRPQQPYNEQNHGFVVVIGTTAATDSGVVFVEQRRRRRRRCRYIHAPRSLWVVDAGEKS
jgi:hypothetical protein